MHTFLAISSILSTDSLSDFIADTYNLKVISCNILKTGISHNYLVTTNENKFVLRVYTLNWRTEKEITEELQLLTYLDTRNFLVAAPIKNNYGNLINTIKAPEGERFAVLFTYAKGQTIKNLSEKQCFVLGKQIARFHQLTKGKIVNRKEYTAKNLVSWGLEQANTFFDTSSNEMKYFKRAETLIVKKLEEADATLLRKGTVHIDFWYENFKVDKNNNFTFFNFDNCGNGWLFLDIAYALMLLFKNEPDKKAYRLKEASFYKGYESIAVISSEEKELIPYGGLAIWLHYTGIHVQRFNDFTNHFLSNEFLKFWIHTVNQWMLFNKITI